MFRHRPQRARGTLQTITRSIDVDVPVRTALGITSAAIQRDLESFKGFIEERGQETGAWRGEVSQDPEA